MATTYLAPGVYVEEVKSDSSPIAGVGTSTAGFIGLIENPDPPPEEPPDPLHVGDDNRYYTTKITGEKVGSADGKRTEFKLSNYPVWDDPAQFTVTAPSPGVGTIDNRDDIKQSFLVFDEAPDGPKIANNDAPADFVITVDYKIGRFTPANEVKLCTNYREFTNFFGSFSSLKSQNALAHAVYGFFNNGGRRCYVAWANGKGTQDGTDIVESILPKFEDIDEIALVAAPGVTGESVQGEIRTHCEKMGDRFAILDSVEDLQKDLQIDLSSPELAEKLLPSSLKSDYGAIYFPWIQVSDPPGSNNMTYIGPSGHIAGIYARVDTERGVHKAPANETVLGALGLKYRVSKIDQEGLNPDGINCIRNINNNILVWGARTMGGDANGEWKYINVRRVMIYLRESIEEGTRWVVFEPNAPDLWAAIRRNVTDFLTTVWRTGALFGDTPEKAFYVKCDEETNPPELRDIGQVVTEIGVAVVRPAEFVIFRISQWSGPTS
ncbi:MAG: phage tail sheath family protein [Oscillatoria sp. SIO1A7]|nr:phage tail sheath family protein [Oscillatoria sp. SIO1A7]